MSKRIVFLGSPDFAIPTLRAIHDAYNVVGVVTQPDRPAGRGKVLTPPPIKIVADELNIPVIQPNRLKDVGVVEKLIEWNADVYIVAAFGQIFRKNILNIPNYGLINVHASLLPRWRGASPIQAAILAGDKTTGISIMKIDEGIDTGDVFNQQSVLIGSHETAGELSIRLAQIGADLLIETLPDYFAGCNTGSPQAEELATYAGLIQKEDAILNISESAEVLVRKIRAYNPWPVAKLDVGEIRIMIHEAHAELGVIEQPGKRFIHRDLPAISTEGGSLVLDRLQLPGKKIVDGKSFLQGNRDWGVKL